MVDKSKLEQLFNENECNDFKWIDPDSIAVSEWVRMKCRFGCPGWGKSLSCPPNTPSVEECRRFFSEYKSSVIFRFTKQVEDPEDRHPWASKINKRLLRVEREVFLSGYEKAFVLAITECRLCSPCYGRIEECRHPEAVRPVPESMAVDVFATARSCGYPIEVLQDYEQKMNRYAILMIE
jgi:predicted metal-binding protein